MREFGFPDKPVEELLAVAMRASIQASSFPQQHFIRLSGLCDEEQPCLNVRVLEHGSAVSANWLGVVSLDPKADSDLVLGEKQVRSY